MTTVRTFGHGTAGQDELLGRLQAAGIERVVDVRIAPGSKRHPHVGRDALSLWLPEAGIGYRWEKRLGGFRKLAPDSPDVALRNDSFRAYAGHMRSSEFAEAIDALIVEASDRAEAAVAVMCSESVWWRCHRRLVADFLVLARDVKVEHLMPDGRLSPHVPTDGVRRRADGLLVYDAGASPLPGAG
ncbi:MAG TPA: DUF488 domain-containing protein [Mycobacteriales bacterium]|nr:DUF488 domain-containing protein [Mycobacteriales bacterium]